MTGWPADWADRLRGKDCPMCASVGKGDNEYGVHLWAGEVSDAWLERRSSVAGYCIVVWRDGHVSEPTELDPEAAAGYWRDLMEVGRAIESAFQPMKVNYMLLGNLVAHLHTHVFPRYADDPAPGGPLAWSALTDVPATGSELLREQAAALRAAANR